MLMADEERNNKELENSKDIVLANALWVKSDALVSNAEYAEAVKGYKLAKTIFENIYGSNIKYMINLSYLYNKGAKAAIHLPKKEDRVIWCSYFLKPLVIFFGKDHVHTLEITKLCEELK